METRRGTKIPFVEEVKEPRQPPKPRIETRAATLIPLLDEPFVEELTGSRLPKCMEVFALFFYLHTTRKMVLRAAKRAAVKKAAKFWEIVSITPKRIDNGINMLTKMHERYQVDTNFLNP